MVCQSEFIRLFPLRCELTNVQPCGACWVWNREEEGWGVLIPSWFTLSRQEKLSKTWTGWCLQGSTEERHSVAVTIQSAISNTPDIVSKNVGLMDDWNSHPRYRLILSSQFLKMANSISELETKQQTKDRQHLEMLFMFYFSPLKCAGFQCDECTKGRTGKKYILKSDTLLSFIGSTQYAVNSHRLWTTAQVSSRLPCSWSQTSQDKDQEMVAHLTVLWLNLKSPNILIWG